MGWDTQINILAEHTGEQAQALFDALYAADAGAYYNPDNAFAKTRFGKSGSVLFMTYERRKYLPYWCIQEISALYPGIRFTVMASCPAFVGGPAGLVRVANGIITDSYGFAGLRQQIQNSPEPELLYRWFGEGGPEQQYREKQADLYPLQWIEECYADNMIVFDVLADALLEELRVNCRQEKNRWMPLA